MCISNCILISFQISTNDLSQVLLLVALKSNSLLFLKLHTNKKGNHYFRSVTDSLRTSFVSKNADDNAYEDIFEDNFERHVAIVHTMCKQSLPSDKIDAEEETSNVGTEDTWNNNFQPTKGIFEYVVSTIKTMLY